MNSLSQMFARLPKQMRLYYVSAVGLLVVCFFVLLPKSSLTDALLPSSVSSLTGGGHSSHYHLILPLSGPNKGFCRTLSTFLLNGWKRPNVLLFQPEDMVPGIPLETAKIYVINRWLKTAPLHDDDIVVQVDALDAWAQKSPEELLAAYRSKWNLSESVIGAELNCYPWRWDQPGCTNKPSISPVDPAKYTVNGKPHDHAADFANTGIIVGSVKSMRTLYSATEMVLRMGRTAGEKGHLFDNDQSLLQIMYISSEFNASLDHSHDIVVNMYQMPENVEVDSFPNANGFDHSLLRVVPSGSYPPIVHFNGKVPYMAYWPKFWWGIPDNQNKPEVVAAWDRVRNGDLTWFNTIEENVVKTWDETCNWHDIDELRA